MRCFETRGPVYPEDNYVVARTEELAGFIDRIEKGRYIGLFAPRQTGKTTFFRNALDVLPHATYYPIRLDFQAYSNLEPDAFYKYFYMDLRKAIENVFQGRIGQLTEGLTQFLDDTEITDHVSMRVFFEHITSFLEDRKVVLIIDEFDGIPQAVLNDFLYSLRQIYLSDRIRCPHSVGIVGIKSISQLNYDRSISPFNIQDEFQLPNFTLEQVRELFAQYTDEVDQNLSSEVIENLYKQTAGQPFLVNRFAQILTEELDIPKTETINLNHFAKAHAQLLEEDNVNLTHMLTNIRRDKRFEALLMQIVSYDIGVRFTLRNETISELATYGVISKGTDGMCEILNPIYHYCIMQTFKPFVNGLENEYLPVDNTLGFRDYLTSSGEIDMMLLLNNFRDFIVRAGFRVLQVPDAPKEFIGQHLLLAYLDQFIQLVGGTMYLEVPTGRGRMDLIILHNNRKYIIETKIWDGNSTYAAGKKQLAHYLRSEGQSLGYYVVFDHRRNPVPRIETETFEDLTIQSYVIPVMQEPPSAEHRTPAEK